MSAEKIQNLFTRSEKIIQTQQKAIKETEKSLFKLGKNYNTLCFGEFRKKFKSLIFSLDLEKYINELSEALLEAENLFKEAQTNGTTDSNKEWIIFIKQSLATQQQLLENFKESLLALREAPQAQFFGKTDASQICLFKNYIIEGLNERTSASSEESKIAHNRKFSIKLTVHLGMLSPFNNHEAGINSLIQKVLNGFIDDRLSTYRENYVSSANSRFRTPLADSTSISPQFFFNTNHNTEAITGALQQLSFGSSFNHK